MTNSDLHNIVSVVTPTYNCKDVIEKAIMSVAQQTISVLEHIVIDDGSTDGTLDKLYFLQSRFPKLKVISQKNLGAGAARNAGIASANGRYIAFLDGDDYWLDQKLEQQIGFMENQQVVFSFGDYTTIDSESEKVLAYCLPDSLSYSQLLDGCPIGCLTVAYNQDVMGKHYMPLIKRGQDWGLWLALTRNNIKAQKYPGNLAVYVYQHNSLSKNKLKKVLDVYQIYVKQENIGYFKAIWHLYRHVKYAMSKKNSLVSS